MVQAQCTKAISEFDFQTKFEALKNTTDKFAILQEAVNLSANNCLSSKQVAEVASLFDNDADRLEYTQRAFKNTVDKENYYEVYNSFFYFSNVFRLHEATVSTGSNSNSGEAQSPNANKSNGEYSIPDYQFYFGPNGCSEPITGSQLESLKQQVESLSGELDKLTKAKSIAQNSCLSTDQAMEVALLLGTEQTRLEYLKYAHTKVYYINHFGYSLQLLNFDASKQELAQVLGDEDLIVSESGSTTTPIENNCIVSELEFQEMYSTLSGQNFNSSKLAMAKQILQKNCLNSNQVTEVIKLFEFETSRLEIAKYAYEYVSDPPNYYKVNEAFEYSSSISKLEDFLKTQ